jgi:hypothetical protein
MYALAAYQQAVDTKEKEVQRTKKTTPKEDFAEDPTIIHVDLSEKTEVSTSGDPKVSLKNKKKKKGKTVKKASSSEADGRDHQKNQTSTDSGTQSDQHQKVVDEALNIINVDLPKNDSVVQKQEDDNDDDNTQVLCWGFVANVILIIGFGAFQGFAILEFNGRDRGIAANATYITAFACFFSSAMIELVIDLVLKRTLAHGRYSNKKGWNVAISLLFIVGTALDITGFFLWNQKNFLPEHRVLYASAHTWLLTAILVLLAEGWGMVAELLAGEAGGLDAAGNVLFFVGALVDCTVRYIDSPGTPHPELSVSRLEFSSSPIWLTSAILYLSADILRLRRHDFSVGKNESRPPLLETPESV